MKTKTNSRWIFNSPKMVFLIIITSLFANCKVIKVKKDSLIGNTSIERKFDEKGALIYYEKINIKSKGYSHRPHMYSITQTTTKVKKGNKLVEFYREKSILSVADLGGRILKSRRIVWDENGKKTVTCTPSK